MIREKNRIPALIARIKSGVDNEIISKTRHHGIDKLFNSHIAILSMVLVHGGSVTLSELNDKIIMKRTTLSDAVIKLEKLEYLQRITVPEDKRAAYVLATHKAKDIEEYLFTSVSSAVDEMLEPLSDDEQKELLRMLEIISKKYE